MKRRAMARQGDLLFVPLGRIPRGAHRLGREQIELNEASGGIVLAHGEATGHSHTLEAPETRVYALGELTDLDEMELAIDVLGEDGAIVTHQEHAALKLERGLWQVQRQRELGWAQDEAPVSISWVAD